MKNTNEKILKELNEIRDHGLDADRRMPDRGNVVSILKEAQVLLFPEHFHYRDLSQEEALNEIREGLRKEICLSLKQAGKDGDPDEMTDEYIGRLPEIKELILTDIQAIYDGDPAAKSKSEVIACYPGFYAISIYRLAHVLYEMGIPYIPRIMTEYAHEKTGIDINPGASIGHHFCIDHGTGIVIGETAVLGHHVKLYQGVTIGAKSFELDADGNPVKGGKRHPNIGNHVVIYANATLLGGDTTIGDNCVIGGSVWLTHSVEAGQTVYYAKDQVQ